MVEGDGVYERIVKNNADGIILTKDRVIVFANQAAADIYGSEDPTEMEGGFLALSIDHEKTKRAFFKTFRNSIEAMPGGGKITVKLEIIDRFVEICIADTGPGIPEVIRDKLFQPFFSTKSSSLGLGLSFCKLAVESNGGSIGLDSAVGEGTTVSIRLPV